ncbi:YciI family protein [Hyphomonas sp.]|uniref:YciI family protein n=1 Tax=Hyphomonas sp. TaxID=87 RepID=UPI00391BE588
MIRIAAGLAAALILAACATAETPPPAPSAAAPAYDADLAARLGADEYGMRPYVLVLLMTGPMDAEIRDPETRGAIFAGHFANMQRLSDEGHLILAGPLGGENGRRGLFLFNTADVEEARSWAATDPAVEAGIFTLEVSTWYGSASLLLTPELHKTLQARGITD